ncbi:GNAT family N-acetyltransferase [Pseudomonas tructae]|uniref:GNAT family N-acetyltransferase n=1 Tax=Pseudomonas tructae TaxID=2518644 RepID=A0A411MKW3_9PSED|nr:GNAT family N-acetyltransferase [Pseudomonas tructae]QBF27433.1 GNAT family N-acetyltransferase [Pseudomonas tructae]
MSDSSAAITLQRCTEQHVESLTVLYNDPRVARQVLQILEVADNWMGLQRVELTVYTDNQPALALYKRFGFTVEGQLIDYAMRDGELIDVYSMARLRRRQR